MRAILTNFGTTGDVQPFLALAVELRRHGHEPVLALSPDFAAWAARLGLPFVRVGPQVKAALRDVITMRVEMTEFLDSVEAIRSFLAPLSATLPELFHDLLAACQGADVLISGPTQPAARMVHDLTGIPFVSVYPSPVGAGGTPAMQQARLLLINPFREQLGLAPLRDPFSGHTSPLLTLYAMSRHIIPPAATWPTHFHGVGFFFLDDEVWQPDPALADFIAAGEPPVVITFGSMMYDDPHALTELLVAAIDRAGCRAIIQQGWSGLAQHQRLANIHVADYVPHRWLFPRAACVVHHGGAGTSGAVFRAGVPHVVVPHAADQSLWAATVQELGCAAAFIPYPDLTAKRLDQAIRRTLSTPGYRQAAAMLGEKVRAEQGVSKARQLIEALVSHMGVVWSEDDRAGPAADQSEDRRARGDRRRQYFSGQRLRKVDPGTKHHE